MNQAFCILKKCRNEDVYLSKIRFIRSMVALILLAMAFISFICLGLPDGIFGIA
jgi:hypothetical protein